MISSRVFRWGVIFAAMMPLALLAQPGARVVPHAPDLMIRTRTSMDRPQSTVRTSTVFLKGSRQRREQLAEFPQGAGNRRAMPLITISQCDTQRTIQVNPDTHLYAIVPMIDPAKYVERQRQLLAQAREEARRNPQPSGPEVVMTIDGVDTGERRAVGGRVARHLVTTTTTLPSAGAAARASERVEDGWYVDLPSPNCDEPNSSAPKAIGVTTMRVAGQPRDNLRVEQHGVVASGFPVQRVIRSSNQTEGIFFTETTELVEVSERGLDEALFAVPAGYQPALPRMLGGFDLTKPDTLGNRFADYRDFVVSWTRSLLARR